MQHLPREIKLELVRFVGRFHTHALGATCREWREVVAAARLPMLPIGTLITQAPPALLMRAVDDESLSHREFGRCISLADIVPHLDIVHEDIFTLIKPRTPVPIDTFARLVAADPARALRLWTTARVNDWQFGERQARWVSSLCISLLGDEYRPTILRLIDEPSAADRVGQWRCVAFDTIRRPDGTRGATIADVASVIHMRGLLREVFTYEMLVLLVHQCMIHGNTFDMHIVATIAKMLELKPLHSEWMSNEHSSDDRPDLVLSVVTQRINIPITKCFLCSTNTFDWVFDTRAVDRLRNLAH